MRINGLTGGRDRDMRGQNLILAKHDVWNFDCYKTICTVTYGQFKGFSRIILIILFFNGQSLNPNSGKL